MVSNPKRRKENQALESVKRYQAGLKLRIKKEQTFNKKLISYENEIEKPNQSRLPGCQQLLNQSHTVRWFL
jgi:hypothetical protein